MANCPTVNCPRAVFVMGEVLGERSSSRGRGGSFGGGGEVLGKGRVLGKDENF